MNCYNCGKSASKDIEEVASESNYDGDYFCSDECRNEVRDREDKLNGYRTA